MTVSLLRALGPLGEPLGLIWLFLAAGAFAAAWKRRWRAAAIPAAAAALLSIVGTPWLSDAFLESFERPYARVDWTQLPQADAIVTLGGSYADSTSSVLPLDLSDAGDRLLTGLELARRGRAPYLVFGEGMYTNQVGQPAMLAQSVAEAYDLRPVQIRYLPPCRNTFEEALKIREVMQQQGWKRILLVTSAIHMRRAVAVFEKAGIEVVPAPCDFRVAGITVSRRPSGPLPQIGYVDQFTAAWHEWIGWWIYRWRGWL